MGGGEGVKVARILNLSKLQEMYCGREIYSFWPKVSHMVKHWFETVLGDKVVPQLRTDHWDPTHMSKL